MGAVAGVLEGRVDPEQMADIVRGLSVDDMQAWSRAMVNAGTENRMLADQMEQVHGMLKKQEELLAGAGKVKPARGLAMLDKLRNLKDRVIVASSGKNMKKLCPNLHQRLSLGHNLAEWCQTKYMSDHFKRAMQEVGDNTVPGTSDMTGLLRRMELSQKMTATFDKEGEAEGMPLEQPESAQLSATMGAGGARPGTAPNVNFAATAGARMQGGRPGTALAATKGGEPYDAFDATAPGFGQTAGTSLGGGGGRSRRKKKSKSVTQPHFRKGMTREQKVNEWKRAKAERERRERERQKRKLHKWKSTGRQTPRKRFPITQQAFTHAIMHHQSLLSVGMDNLNAAECRKLWQKCKRDYHKFIKYLFSEEIDADKLSFCSKCQSTSAEGLVVKKNFRHPETGKVVSKMFCKKCKTEGFVVQKYRVHCQYGSFDSANHGERYIAPPKPHEIPSCIRYKPFVKTTVQAPTGWDTAQVTRSGQMPQGEMALDFIYGYDSRFPPPYGDNGKGGGPNIWWTKDEEPKLLYYVAAVGVLFDPPMPGDTRATNNTQQFMKGHTNDMTGMCLSPCGKYAASCQLGKENMIIVWDMKPEHYDEIEGTFPKIATIGYVTETVSDPKPGQDATQEKPFFDRAICAVAFSTDSKAVIGIGCDDRHTMGVFSIATGELLAKAETQNGVPIQIFSLVTGHVPDQKPKDIHMVTCGQKKHIKFWHFRAKFAKANDPANPPLVFAQARFGSAETGIPVPRDALCACYLPNGAVITGVSDGRVYAWNPLTAERLWVCQKDYWTPDPTSIGEMHSYTKRTKEKTGAGKAHWAPVFSVCPMPGGFLSGGVDGTVVRWVLTDSSMKKSSDETVYVCEPKPPKKDDDDDDTPLPMNFSFERAHTWNVNAWEDAQEGKGKEKQTDVDDAMDDAAFAADAGGEDGDEDGDMEVGLDDGADEEEILGGSQPDEFTVGVRCLHATWADSHWFWDAGKKGNGEFEFKQTITVVVATLHSDIWVFKLGPDGSVGCSKDHALVDTNAAEVMKGHYEQVQALTPHPSIPYCFATGGYDQNVVVWDGRVTKSSVWEISLPGKVMTLDWKPPEGDELAVGTESGELIILNSQMCASGAETSSTWYAIKHHDMMLEDLKYSPNGRYLAVSSHDNTIDLYKCDMNYVHHRRLSGHGAFVTHLDWSKDSLTMQSCDGGGELLYWNAPTGAQIVSRYDSTEADTEWDEFTCVIGFPVMGIWQDSQGLNDVNSLHRSDDENYIVTAGDDGVVRLFNCPCVVEDAPSREYKGHAAHVSQVRFLMNDEALVTTGSNDISVMQWKFFPRGRMKASFEDDELSQMTLLAETGAGGTISAKPPAKFGKDFDPLGTRTVWRGDQYSVWK